MTFQHFPVANLTLPQKVKGQATDKYLIDLESSMLYTKIHPQSFLGLEKTRSVIPYEGHAKSFVTDYFSATFYQTYFYAKPSKYSPFTETHFCNLFTQSRKADK